MTGAGNSRLASQPARDACGLNKTRVLSHAREKYSRVIHRGLYICTNGRRCAGHWGVDLMLVPGPNEREEEEKEKEILSTMKEREK